LAADPYFEHIPTAVVAALLSRYGVPATGSGARDIVDACQRVRQGFATEAEIEWTRWYMKLKTGFEEALDEHAQVLESVCAGELTDTVFGGAALSQLRTAADALASRLATVRASLSTTNAAIASQQSAEANTAGVMQQYKDTVALHQSLLAHRCGWSVTPSRTSASDLVCKFRHADGSETTVGVTVDGSVVAVTAMDLQQRATQQSVDEELFGKREHLPSVLTALLASVGVSDKLRSVSDVTSLKQVRRSLLKGDQ
jgi:hypothetical protein